MEDTPNTVTNAGAAAGAVAATALRVLLTRLPIALTANRVGRSLTDAY